MEHTKGPPTWIAPLLATTSIFLFVAWAYVQIRHWSDPNADYLRIGLTLLLSGLSVILLVAVFLINRGKATQATQDLHSFQATQAGHKRSCARTPS